MSDHDWRDIALCREFPPDIFYPEKGAPTRYAKAVCRTCEVTTECLNEALTNDERFGVWAGLSERERRRLKGSARSA